MLTVMSDGSVLKVKDVPVNRLPKDVVVVIKKPEFKPHPDSAFIHSLSKRNGKRMGRDNAGLDSEEFINTILLSNSARVVLINFNGIFEYVGFSFLDDFENNLTASIHGMIRDCDFMGNKTNKYLKQFQKYKIFDILIDDYFKSYHNHSTFNVETIEAYLPDFLKEKICFDKDTQAYKHILLPSAKIIEKCGFKCINSRSPRRNACLKNGKARDLFIYQIHKKWWNRTKPVIYGK